ncbi:hypothetical protein COB64_03875 [Candidatus Wolfebacteria bacterium]|nr:MAG: hypothetical protein COB64_03875 [Candidatus Wolfebacteria bacterium]
MELFTEETETELQKQYKDGSSLSQNVIVKIFNPYSSWALYIINQDPKDPDYLWAIVKGFEVEIGSVSKSELTTQRVPPFNTPLERDLFFTSTNTKEVWNKLRRGEHV